LGLPPVLLTREELTFLFGGCKAYQVISLTTQTIKEEEEKKRKKQKKRRLFKTKIIIFKN
jgi:hypothetical protein